MSEQFPKDFTGITSMLPSMQGRTHGEPSNAYVEGTKRYYIHGVEVTEGAFLAFTQQATAPLTIYERRQLNKQLMDAYRDAAREHFASLTRYSVSPHANVQLSIDRDGAFVEVVVWVPRELFTCDGNHAAPRCLDPECWQS